MNIERIISASQSRLYPDLRELWSYRDLVYFLARRSIIIRYKQTIVGAGWIIIQPLMMMIVFSVLFGHFGKLPSDGLPYPVFVFSAILPWQFFSRVLSETSISLVSHKDLITKVYFPPIVVPLSIVAAAAVDFALASLILLALMFYFKIVPALTVLLIPGFLVLLVAAVLGVGLMLATLNVKYRDTGQAVPFILQIWMFMTPVIYPAKVIPESWSLLYALNPMVAVIEGVRWCLFGTGTGPGLIILVSSVVAVALFVSGVCIFTLKSRKFVDVLGA